MRNQEEEFNPKMQDSCEEDSHMKSQMSDEDIEENSSEVQQSDEEHDQNQQMKHNEYGEEDDDAESLPSDSDFNHKIQQRKAAMLQSNDNMQSLNGNNLN